MQNKYPDKEINTLSEITNSFLRHPQQVNQFLEADAEIIQFKNNGPGYLVLKMDGIHEEIREKLYQDPYLIGWMSVTATISDMAAVGAQPFGILLSLQLFKQYDQDWLVHFQRGINDACAAYHIYVLGGDTSFDSILSVTTTSVGYTRTDKPLLRKGMKAGQHLYSSGTLGLGNAFAYARYFDPTISIAYQPLARLKESRLLQHYATACIDTSDGLFPALSVLAEVNNIGFRLITPLQDILHREVIPVYRSARLPAWMFMAGPHGEYELLFTIPPQWKNQFKKACSAENWQPVFLGKITEDKVLQFSSEKLTVSCQPAIIANLFEKANRNISLYFELLMNQQDYWYNNQPIL